MDPQTRQLVDELRRNPHDPHALDAARAHLMARQDFRTLAELLRWWSRKAGDPRRASWALTEAARLLLECGEPGTRVAALWEQALAEDPACRRASLALEHALLASYEHDRLSRALAAQLGALRRDPAQEELLREVAERLGRLRIEVMDDPDGALQVLRLAVETPNPSHAALTAAAHAFETRAARRDDPDQAKKDRARAAQLRAHISEPDDSEVTDIHQGYRELAPTQADESRIALLSELENAQRHDAQARGQVDLTQEQPTRGRARRPVLRAVSSPRSPEPPAPLRGVRPGTGRAAALATRAETAPHEPAPTLREITPPSFEPPAPPPVEDPVVDEPLDAQGIAPRGADDAEDPTERLAWFDEDEEASALAPATDVREILRGLAPETTRGRLAVEVLRHDAGRVLGSDLLRTVGARWRSRALALSVWRTPGGALVRTGPGTRATIERGPERRAVESRTWTRLGRHDVLRVRKGELCVRVGVTALPAPPTAAREVFPLKRAASAVGAALLLHLLAAAVLLSLSQLGVELRVDEQSAQEIFAEGTLQNPKPQPNKKRRRPRVRKLREATPEPVRALPKSLRKHVKRDRPRSAPTTAGLLATLKQAPEKSVAAAVTSIDAVKGNAPSSVLAVGGVLGATADGSLRVATGSRAVETAGGRSATDALARLNKRSGSGRVRGKVRGIRALAKVEGSLSRSAVMEVINRKLGRIQGCYERALTATPNLSGQVRFSWTILENGRVRGVREASSSLGARNVSTCIAGVLRGLRFPRPQGGPVRITFPFIFQRAS